VSYLVVLVVLLAALDAAAFWYLRAANTIW